MSQPRVWTPRVFTSPEIPMWINPSCGLESLLRNWTQGVQPPAKTSNPTNATQMPVRHIHSPAPLRPVWTRETPLQGSVAAPIRIYIPSCPHPQQHLPSWKRDKCQSYFVMPPWGLEQRQAHAHSRYSTDVCLAKEVFDPAVSLLWMCLKEIFLHAQRCVYNDSKFLGETLVPIDSDHLLKFSLISFNWFCHFQCTNLTPPWLN